MKEVNLMRNMFSGTILEALLALAFHGPVGATDDDGLFHGPVGAPPDEDGN
jgi:hypothetical protein